MCPFLILSLDGGGLRGVFEARLLDLIATHCGRPRFHLVAGTSTGAILGTAWAMDLDMSVLLERYLATREHLFQRRFFLGPRLLERAVHSPYQNQRLRALLRQVFGRRCLGEVGQPLLIPATNLETSAPHVFSSAATHDVLAYDAVMASCCAPAFFDPFNHRGHLLADGALYANNPAMLAVSAAVGICGARLEDLRILSLGTGHFRQCYHKDIQIWGLATGWKARTLMEFTATLNSEAVCRQVSSMLPADNVLRLNFEHTKLIAADDFSCGPELVELAEQCFARHRVQIMRLLEQAPEPQET